MRVIVLPTSHKTAEVGAAIVADLVRDNPAAVLGVATGSSPQPLYAALAARAMSGLDFSAVTAFALDEYVGIDPAHPASYHRVLKSEVMRPLGVGAMHVPDGFDDPRRASTNYEAAIARSGGIDLQILGIGVNGHLAFNEPGSAFDSRTREVELTAQTRSDNRRFFGGNLDAVPLRAITQGLGTILEAGTLLLVANGLPKAEAIALAIEGSQSTSCPASAIQAHPDVIVLLDAAAASLLTRQPHDVAANAGWLKELPQRQTPSLDDSHPL